MPRSDPRAPAELPPDKGAWVPLYDREETIGAVLRTRTRVSAVFVSISHRVSLESAIDFTLRCTTRYRLPETTRRAHRLASGLYIACHGKVIPTSGPWQCLHGGCK